VTAIPEPGPAWPDAVLAARHRLPATPDVGVVATPRLTVRPYREADAEELFAISDGRPAARMGRSVGAYDAEELIWRFMHAGPFADAVGLNGLHMHFASMAGAQPYTVADAATGELVGSVTLLANVPADLRVEIGNVWYTPAVQGLGVNREVTLALADVAFGLGYQRFEWKCNALNLRSRHAAEAMGFSYEGTFRAHMVVKGRRRDTAWFSLLPHEHPDRTAPESG
jgi:RimJ/RimL family protein N-acetyltransferase